MQEALHSVKRKARRCRCVVGYTTAFVRETALRVTQINDDRWKE